MAIRKVLRMGHPVLRQKSRDLTREEILAPAFKQLLQDMIETMNDYGGIGLAAPQIGESLQVAIIDYSEEDEQQKERYPHLQESLPFTVVINPRITVLSDETQSYWEGCLSVPDLRGLVERPKKIKVDYLDLKAQAQSVTVEGFTATVFQHEIDHLQGVLYIDRVKNEVGKTALSFVEEFQKYLVPHEVSDQEEGIE